MSISGFYNTTAILETFTTTEDEYGQAVKTWVASTTIIGTKQGRSGNKSVINTQDRISKNERFYCNYQTIHPSGRLVFSNSTISFNFQGTASASIDLASTTKGALYFIDTAFSTFGQYDYALFNGTAYVTPNVTRNDILFVNDRLRNRHLEIDLDLDHRDR